MEEEQESKNPEQETQNTKPTTGSDLLDDTSFGLENAEPENRDEEAMVAGVEAVGKVSIFFAHIKQAVLKVWKTPRYRYPALAGILLTISLLSWWPTSRYATLNAFGARADARVAVFDQESARPVPRVQVKLGDSVATTDDEGIAQLESVRLGKGELLIDKPAYAALQEPVQIGLGKNVLEDITLTPIGTQFAFEVNDWLSDESIEGARVSFGESEAVVDESGVALLRLPPTDEERIEIQISADNYRTVSAELDTTSSATSTVQLVSSPRNYFVSRRNGSYDVYASNLDGSEQELLIPGTGAESNDIRFSVGPKNQFAALVSTRNGIRDTNGRLQKDLHMVDLEKPAIDQIDQSQDIQLVDWIGSKLIYVRIGEGESAFSPRRHQLMSFDLESGSQKVLEASNNFNDVKVIQGKIYYAADDSFKQEQPKPYLYRIDENGQNRTALIERQSWTIFQSSYDEIVVNTTKNGWFRYNIARDELTELSGQPSTLQDRRYEDGPDNKSVWIDERDGKGVLLVYNTETKQEDVVHQVGGLTSPVRWINDDKLIFRVSNNQETGDYIVDLQGGEPQKITDTSNVSSATRWFYY